MKIHLYDLLKAAFKWYLLLFSNLYSLTVCSPTKYCCCHQTSKSDQVKTEANCLISVSNLSTSFRKPLRSTSVTIYNHVFF